MSWFGAKQLKEAVETTSEISPLNYPFKQGAFESLHIYAYRSGSISGGIEFKNGQTEGKQKFTANSIRELLQQMETFIAKLEA